MVGFSADITRRLLHLKRVICKRISESKWRELGIVTQCSEIVENHSRLLRSLYFGDEDYDACVIEVLESVIRRDEKNIDTIENYVIEVTEGANGIIDVPDVLNRYVCSPGVFKVPEGGIDSRLVSVMMLLDAQSDSVCNTIKEAVAELGLICKRADDIWEDSTVIQDVFTLIYHSTIVICDFSCKNANVLYEAGIAHTLGRKVIPLAQHISDIPFEIRHHRHLMYLPDKEGLSELKIKLSDKLRQEIGNDNSIRRA